jgi:macrolide-specific efflux system membrane fusion protein
MNRNTARKLIIGVTALVFVVMSGLLVKSLVRGSRTNAYLTAKVVRADLQSAVMSTGTLQAYQQVDVGAQVSGQLQSLKARLGEQVAKGQLLAEIDPVLSQNALRFARASLDSLLAQHRAVAASLQQADLAHRRQLAMLAKDATSRQEVEAAKAQLQVLRANLASFDAQISQAKIQVDSAQTNLAYTKITAPMEGEVVAIVTQEGQTVVAAQQAPVILKLANLDIMTVKAQISEADVIRIQPGQTAYFTILGDAAERRFGKLDAIEPAPQDFLNGGAKVAGPVYYNALFDTPNADHRLRIAMTAQVSVVLAEAKNALCVPISALGSRTADGRYPLRMVRAGGRIETITVGVGINDNVRVQIVDGINEGDDVIIESGSGKAPPADVR